LYCNKNRKCVFPFPEKMVIISRIISACMQMRFLAEWWIAIYSNYGDPTYAPEEK
jgi:hypothetical protein